MKHKTKDNYFNDYENVSLIIEKCQKRLEEEREIQKEYEFSIPSYVLSEMKKINENVFALINLAQLNNRISKENAEILKNSLKNKFKYEFI